LLQTFAVMGGDRNARMDAEPAKDRKQ
jgi:hypothetical protein